MDDLDARILAVARGANAKLGNVDIDPFEDFYTQGLDSLDHVQILMRVEEAFGVTIADSDYDLCTSLARIRDFILRERHGAAA
ncbi:phosphopantetheine-binding protein [Starkeya koreensis]|uniref:Phosphopantetheine-binding protein n=1 Tax=Ancylobacter koreensis TaxID=266121 RepID=A0ABT0DIC3_9HYPH|nr:phosphopantetheine-binding protein [Ancylobacter koreensis]MCK0206837.1 phosphopantetheine-binding protein [Ancylobacter koreensis]